MPLHNNKKGLQSSLDIMNYFKEFSPLTAVIFKLLRKLASLKSEWPCNNIYQNLYERATTIITKNVTMAFYSEKKQLYVETRCLGCKSHLRGSLLQTKDRMQFPCYEAPNNLVLWPVPFICKGLNSAETQYSNVESEALGIIHGLETFHP